MFYQSQKYLLLFFIGVLKPRVLLKGADLWITDLVAYTDTGADLKARTKHLMDTLQSLVVSCGEKWSMSNIVLVHLYVQNMADFADINSVYKTYFGINPAAR